MTKSTSQSCKPTIVLNLQSAPSTNAQEEEDSGVQCHLSITPAQGRKGDLQRDRASKQTHFGVFLCATGVGVVIGAIFIFYWGIQKLEEAKQGNSYTENNFTANIDHYHASNDGPDIDDWRKSATPIHGGVSEDVPKDHFSKDTREENR